MTSNIGLLVTGVAFLWISVWFWRGKTRAARWWTRTSQGDLLALVIFPSLGLMFTGAALGNLGAPDWLAAPLAIGGLLMAPWSLLISILSMIWWPIQRVWGPRWYTGLTKKQMYDALLDPATDLMRRADAAPAETRQPHWFGRSHQKWHGARIENTIRPAKRDAVIGVLYMGEGGIWFDAPGAPEKIQKRATMSVRWADLIDARSVRDNENSDGEPVPGRSFLPRLVLQTTSKTYLFEITRWQATKVARTITNEKNSRAETPTPPKKGTAPKKVNAPPKGTAPDEATAPNKGTEPDEATTPEKGTAPDKATASNKVTTPDKAGVLGDALTFWD